MLARDLAMLQGEKLSLRQAADLLAPHDAGVAPARQARADAAAPAQA